WRPPPIDSEWSPCSASGRIVQRRLSWSWHSLLSGWQMEAIESPSSVGTCVGTRMAAPRVAIFQEGMVSTSCIRLFGELALFEPDGRPVALPASRKTRALLGFLLATGQAHRRERLCDL